MQYLDFIQNEIVKLIPLLKTKNVISDYNDLSPSEDFFEFLNRLIKILSVDMPYLQQKIRFDATKRLIYLKISDYDFSACMHTALKKLSQASFKLFEQEFIEKFDQENTNFSNLFLNLIYVPTNITSLGCLSSDNPSSSVSSNYLLEEAKKYYRHLIPDNTNREPLKSKNLQDLSAEIALSNFCLGEDHGETVSLNFIKLNMKFFKDNEFTTIFMEHFSYNIWQPLIDDYLNNEEQTIPKELTCMIEAWHPFRADIVQEIFVKAKELKIRIVAVDLPGIHTGKTISSDDRVMLMNYVAQSIIKDEHKTGKWIFVGGCEHVARYKAFPFPSLSTLTNSRSLIIMGSEAMEYKLPNDKVMINCWVNSDYWEIDQFSKLDAFIFVPKYIENSKQSDMLLSNTACSVETQKSTETQDNLQDICSFICIKLDDYASSNFSTFPINGLGHQNIAINFYKLQLIIACKTILPQLTTLEDINEVLKNVQTIHEAIDRVSKHIHFDSVHEIKKIQQQFCIIISTKDIIHQIPKVEDEFIRKILQEIKEINVDSFNQFSGLNLVIQELLQKQNWGDLSSEESLLYN